MTTHHTASSAGTSRVMGKETASESPEQAMGDILSTKLSSEDGEMVANEYMSGLELKLKQLEREKSELDIRRNLVGEDIKALKRAL